jgi:hypothetical protein
MKAATAPPAARHVYAWTLSTRQVHASFLRTADWLWNRHGASSVVRMSLQSGADGTTGHEMSEFERFWRALNTALKDAGQSPLRHSAARGYYGMFVGDGVRAKLGASSIYVCRACGSDDVAVR